MSGNNGNNFPSIQTQALWTWTGQGTQSLKAVGYPPNGQPTKSGIMPTDLANFVGVPLVIRAANGVATPVPTSVQIQWIRWAEDIIEQETGIRLCQTWVAAPAARSAYATQQIGVANTDPYQVLGTDYDLNEPPYDFRFENAQDDGWMFQKLRWKPVQGPTYDDPNGMKNYAYIYPLLNAYFRVSSSWFVTDPDYGIVRLVPSTNVQMLPLFAMQITFQGFSNTVPGGIWIQYVAGLTANDYNSNYSFMQEYVLCVAAMTALAVIQGSVNFGITESTTTTDGLSQKLAYSAKGAYVGLIDAFTAQAKMLKKQAKSKVGGPTLTFL